MEIKPFGFSALSHHFMVIIKGSVHTWGWNKYGQLGDGTTIDRNKPDKIRDLDNVVSIAWGLYHSMAMTQNGDVYLWGSNENGELGDGTTIPSTTPKKLNILDNIKIIACSSEHYSMLVTNDGDVYCWGKNDIGQLGDGTTNQSTTPLKINNISNIATIGCGNKYTIAMSEEGDVYSWGLNNYGQLGNGSTINSTVPQKINNFTNVTTIACGSTHALALMSCGDVFSWGYNGHGELGNGNTNNTSTPQKIPNLVNIVAISCGYYHSMALTRDGDLYSWGNNNCGQLGVGSTTESSTPLKVNVTHDNVCTIACVGNNSMVLTTNGHIFVWGYNTHGQLCNGTSTKSTTPQKLDLPYGTLRWSSPIQSEPNVASYLKALGYGQYLESFDNIGAKSIDDILLFEEEDWKHLNVLPFQKKKILASIPRKDTATKIHQNQENVEALVPKPTPTLAFEPTPLVPAKGHKNRFVFEDSGDFKGVVEIINNFTPMKTCKEYIQELSKEEGCQKFELILADCEHWISLKMQKHFFNPQNLEQNEVLALVIYAWDLGFNGTKEENFYFVLNKMLRKRSPAIVQKWAGYLYFMQKALSKLPDLKMVVYRGVSDRKLIEDNYILGRKIHWSAFSSTSVNLKSAREFATPSGIVLSIQIFNGKSIQSYSPFEEEEEEILLSPNMSFFVSQGIHQHDGYNQVVLVQTAPEITFVF